MSPPPSAGAPSRSAGGRKFSKIALIACVAVLAVAGMGFEYMRQRTMVAASNSFFRNIDQQPGSMPLTAPPVTDQQETASAQSSTDTNAQNAPAAGFDAGPQTQTADATAQSPPPAAAPNLTLTNAPQVTQDQALNTNTLIPTSPAGYPSDAIPPPAALSPSSPAPTPVPAPAPSPQQ